MSRMRYVRSVDRASFKPGEFDYEWLGNFESAQFVSVQMPSRTTGPAMHFHTTCDQFYFVRQGEMTVNMGDEHITADVDTLVRVPAGTTHCNWNDGEETEYHTELIAPMFAPDKPMAHPAEPRHNDGAAKLFTKIDRDAFADEPVSTQALISRETGSEQLEVDATRLLRADSPPPMRIHSFDQYYLVVSGELRVEIGLEEDVLRPGELAVVPAGMPHRVWNSQPDPEIHLTALAPEPAVAAELDGRAVELVEVRHA